jgi:hypothetical protein
VRAIYFSSEREEKYLEASMICDFKKDSKPLVNLKLKVSEVEEKAVEVKIELPMLVYIVQDSPLLL